MFSVPSSGWLWLGASGPLFRSVPCANPAVCDGSCSVSITCSPVRLHAWLWAVSLKKWKQQSYSCFYFKKSLKIPSSSTRFYKVIFFCCLWLLPCKRYLILVEAHCHCAIKVVKNSQEERKKQTRSRHHRTAQTDRRRGSKQELWWMQRHYGQEVLQ